MKYNDIYSTTIDRTSEKKSLKKPMRISSVMGEMTHDPRSMLYGLELKKEVRHE
jgi:hypothetical protein